MVVPKEDKAKAEKTFREIMAAISKCEENFNLHIQEAHQTHSLKGL